MTRVAAEPEDRGAARSARPLVLAGLMAVAGALHFVVPRAYERIMPSWLPRAWDDALIAASGAAEIACAALLVAPRTRRLGGWLTAALLVAVYPANIQHAVQGGIPGASGAAAGAAVAWLRLPLQIPLFLWAVTVARRAPATRDARS